MARGGSKKGRKLSEETAAHRAFVTTQYGEDAEAAFRKISSLDTPVALEGLYAQLAERSANEAATAKVQLRESETRARLREADQNELARLRNEKSEKKRKAEQAKRRAASRSGKAGRRKKRK